MKKLHIDVCALCRPFDDQSQLRVRLETDALFLILRYIESKNHELIVSPIHHLEISAIADSLERQGAAEILMHYGKEVEFNRASARKRAEELHQQSSDVADAAHLAVAEQLADVFLSCDDKLLKKYRRLYSNIVVQNPVEFLIAENLK
jgi:predicted nucleic acid-binding protein